MCRWLRLAVGRRKFCEGCPATTDTPGRAPKFGPLTIPGAVVTRGELVPPGNTTLPNVRVIFGLVALVPPGKTTLPKPRVTVGAAAPRCCANPLVIEANASNSHPILMG